MRVLKWHENCIDLYFLPFSPQGQGDDDDNKEKEVYYCSTTFPTIILTSSWPPSVAFLGPTEFLEFFIFLILNRCRIHTCFSKTSN